MQRVHMHVSCVCVPKESIDRGDCRPGMIRDGVSMGTTALPKDTRAPCLSPARRPASAKRAAVVMRVHDPR